MYLCLALGEEAAQQEQVAACRQDAGAALQHHLKRGEPLDGEDRDGFHGSVSSPLSVFKKKS